ncbi:MAG: hypothetical protein H6510_08640 [Acidobacteria bacterium]|nr:hypothetical protein [Acidobacteriota bacterium]MCB9397869.1 hypothetical protein [Acidobacteriota bacterium]
MLMFLFLLGSDVLRFGPFEVFEPLDRREIVVSQQGEVFLLDRTNCLIHPYSPQGEALPVFGGKGQGPGELVRPLQIQINGQKIMVFDFNGGLTFHVFSLDGTFLETQKQPEGMPSRPYGDGWLQPTWRYAINGAKGDPGGLDWIDAEGKKSTLLNMRPPGAETVEAEQPMMMFKPGPDGVMHFKMNPAPG